MFVFLWSLLAALSILPSSPAVDSGGRPTLPGDCNLDWSVDGEDYLVMSDCLAGPDSSVEWYCSCYDLDADSDVDLQDYLLFQQSYTGSQILTYAVAADGDDGTEVSGQVWADDGLGMPARDLVGSDGADSFTVGLRFHVDEVVRGETFSYARLILPGTGDGQVDSPLAMRIVGVAADEVAGYSTAPPSQLPRTLSATTWHVDEPWPDSDQGYECNPLNRYSPNIADIINEILARPSWGESIGGKTVGLLLEPENPVETGYVAFEDFEAVDCAANGHVAASLQLYRSVRSTFVGKEMIARPTDESALITALSLLTLEAYVEYGTKAGVFDLQTATATYPGGVPMEIALDSLLPDTKYYYRLCYRVVGAAEFEKGPERCLRTQRAEGKSFVFTVQSDSHVNGELWLNVPTSRSLYRRTLRNVANDEPDFHIDLGDTFYSESYGSRDALDFADVVDRHLTQRPLLGAVCHSSAFFMALGNHEAEQGWLLDGTPDNLAIWATNARKMLYPLPAPDGFYAGNGNIEDYVGLRENYYAWEWGDALFVVLDPYWYTTTKPHGRDGTPGSGDNWDWTLGLDQYAWMWSVLQASDATYKFVFIHQLVGGVNSYGRGGVEAASHDLGGKGSFEWGGDDSFGHYVFDIQRPGWRTPIHDIFMRTGVTIVFHGHDHVFVKQDLEGIVYQECPMPNDAWYGEGFLVGGLYTHGDVVDNSGHLRVSVDPTCVTVDYVRAYLPGEGPNGQIAYSYTINAQH